MSDARADLLSAVTEEVAARGMADRSLRSLAAAVGTSHRMLLYHFGSREGLIAAVTAEVDARERALMLSIAATSSDPADVARRLWAEVSSIERRPYVRMFFESLTSAPGRAGGHDDVLTEPWLEAGNAAAQGMGRGIAPVDLRLMVGVVRGLLIDVLNTGDTEAATASFERFLSIWTAAGPDG